MRKRLIQLLADPNDASRDFELFGARVRRGASTVENVAHADLGDDDDVELGYLRNRTSGRIYPIEHAVLSILSDDDLPVDRYLKAFQAALTFCPAADRELLEENVARLSAREASSATGVWNQEEMAYYDAAVDSEQKRSDFLREIRRKPLWHIFLERERHLIAHLERDPVSRGAPVLELGCGNARTISHLYRPRDKNYTYVGTDISLQRLFLAKQVLPESDFVQCSALNLPFEDGSFGAVIAFGVLHHLPSPEAGILEGLKKLRDRGLFLIHEPIEKPVRVFANGRFKRLERLLEGYEHSEHDNELDWNAAQEHIRRNSIDLVSAKQTVTAFRTIAARVYEHVPLLGRSQRAWRALIAVDDAIAGLACRTPNILGPGAVFAVLKKPRASTPAA